MISVRVEGNTGEELLKLETCSSRGNSATDKENTEGQRALKITWGSGARLPSAGLHKSLRLPGPPPQDETAVLGMCTGDRADQTQAELAALRTWRVLFLFPQMACPL